MLNIHHEELPAFRNAQSVIWQLHEGRNKTGYTVHEITREIDGGRILKQSRSPSSSKTRLVTPSATPMRPRGMLPPKASPRC